MAEIKSFVATFLGAICFGWFSKWVGLVIDPIVTAILQYAWRLGWVGVVFVVALYIKQYFEDYAGYVAMGLFALPAIITFLLPWDTATLLMGLSVIALAIMGRKVVFGWFGIRSGKK